MTKNRAKVKENFILDPKKSALLIMDVQNHFADPKGRSYLETSESTIPNILKLASWGSGAGIPVLLTQHSHKDENDLGLMAKVYNDYIKDGEWDSEIIDDLKNIKNCKIIKKNTYDAFWNTNLQELLSLLNVEQLILCGCLTHLCCESTARSAFVRGFEVYFISDATFSSTKELHEGSLCNITNGFGLVTTTQSISSCC
jgi:nicotinamidase-related amidase